MADVICCTFKVNGGLLLFDYTYCHKNLDLTLYLDGSQAFLLPNMTLRRYLTGPAAMACKNVLLLLNMSCKFAKEHIFFTSPALNGHKT